MKKLDDKELKKVDGGSTVLTLWSKANDNKVNRTSKNTLDAKFNVRKKNPVSKPASRKNQRTK